MLQNAGFKPPVLDMAQEIDEGLAAANAALERIKRRRAFLVERGGAVQADRDRFNRARAKAIEEYRAALKTINDRVLALSITAPSALHRRSVPLTAPWPSSRAHAPLCSRAGTATPPDVGEVAMPRRQR